MCVRVRGACAAPCPWAARGLAGRFCAERARRYWASRARIGLLLGSRRMAQFFEDDADPEKGCDYGAPDL